MEDTTSVKINLQANKGKRQKYLVFDLTKKIACEQAKKKKTKIVLVPS